MPNNLQAQLDQLRRDLDALNAEVYTNNFSASQDFNKYSRFNTAIKVPTLAVTPATCEIGQLCVVSGKLYVCSAADTWQVVGAQTA